MKNLITLLAITLMSCGQEKAGHKNLNEIAAELNLQCPKMLDDWTRFDKAKSSNNNLELTFTLVKMDKDSTDTEGLTKELKELLSNNLSKGFSTYKTQIDLIFIKQNNVSMHYIFLDKYKRILSDIIIKPTDYGKKYER